MGLEAERMHLLRSKVPEIPNEAGEDRLQNKKNEGNSEYCAAPGD
jgi:hypothetical protein